MTSVLNVDEIAAKNGTDPVVLTKQSGVKAHNNFDQGDNTSGNSLNISSTTDNGVSDITANWTNSWTDITYCPAGFGGFDSVSQSIWICGVSNAALSAWKTTGLLRYQANYASGSRNSDVDDFNILVVGDLA
jgi:hypothetical protein